MTDSTWVWLVMIGIPVLIALYLLTEKPIDRGLLARAIFSAVLITAIFIFLRYVDTSCYSDC